MIVFVDSPCLLALCKLVSKALDVLRSTQLSRSNDGQSQNLGPSQELLRHDREIICLQMSHLTEQARIIVPIAVVADSSGK